MSSTEYFIIAGMILVGIIFFFIAQTFIFSQSEEVKRLGIKAESEEIASLIYRISKDPAPYLKYCQLINLANITIEKSMLKYERGGYEFISLLPPNVSDTKLIEVAQLCIIKENNLIKVLGVT
jgi:CBS domain containing-hemolysin-like protein